MATAYARFSVPTCPSDGRWDVEETIREYSEAFLSASAAEVIFIGKCYPDNTGGIRFPFLVRAWTKANAEEVRLVDIPPLEVRLQMLLENALHTTAGSFDVTTYRVGTEESKALLAEMRSSEEKEQLDSAVREAAARQVAGYVFLFFSTFSLIFGKL